MSHIQARAILAIALSACAAASVSRADTLEDAMASAMRHYPPILAEAARMQAAKAGINVAQAGWYPRVTASGDIGAGNSGPGLSAGSQSTSLGAAASPFGSDWTTRWSYSLMAEQAIFDGHRTRSAVAEAQAGADAATAQVRVVEQLVLMETVTVFADVLRDRDVEALRARDAAAHAEQVASMRERSARGDASATDVAQTQARHAQAIAELITARAGVAARVAEYARVVGRTPGKLVRPRLPASLLPPSLEATIASANANHPVATATGFKEDASRHAVDRQRADGLPQVKLRGGVEGDHALSGGSAGRDAASVSMRLTIPVFDGGETAGRVDQARHVNRSLVEESRGVRERLHAGAVIAWTGLVAARERTVVERRAVTENEQAVAGMKEEIRLGQRTVIDVLDAQRDLVSSQVRVASSEREMLVAAYALLSAAGILSLQNSARVVPTKATGALSGWQTGTIVVPVKQPEQSSRSRR